MNLSLKLQKVYDKTKTVLTILLLQYLITTLVAKITIVTFLSLYEYTALAYYYDVIENSVVVTRRCDVIRFMQPCGIIRRFFCRMRVD